MCVLLLASQLYFRLRGPKIKPDAGAQGEGSPPMPGQMAPQRIPVTPAE
jgi:hypothetical protein